MVDVLRSSNMKRVTRILLISALVIVGLSLDRAVSGPPPSIILSADQWTPIGPAPGGGFFSGRIDAAASDAGNSAVMYVAGTVGGIWKTTNWLDATPTWTEITDKPQ